MNDSMIAGTAICLAFILALTVSRRIQGTIITMPMIYVTLGLVLSPLGLNLVNFNVRGEFVQITAELTLVLVLASDASRIRMRALRDYHTIPLRLLSIGLPLMILVGAILAVLMFGKSLYPEVIILAIVLAPTDAGLGQAIVMNPAVPARIRQALNVEGGLNDGLAMPFLLLAITLLPEVDASYGLANWAGLAVTGIVIGALVGVAVGVTGGTPHRMGREQALDDEQRAEDRGHHSRHLGLYPGRNALWQWVHCRLLHGHIGCQCHAEPAQ